MNGSDFGLCAITIHRLLAPALVASLGRCDSTQLLRSYAAPANPCPSNGIVGVQVSYILGILESLARNTPEPGRGKGKITGFLSLATRCYSNSYSGHHYRDATG